MVMVTKTTLAMRDCEGIHLTFYTRLAHVSEIKKGKGGEQRNRQLDPVGERVNVNIAQ